MGSSCPCHDCPIRCIGIFSSLCDEDLFKIKEFTHQNFYKRRQIIFHEGNSCQGFYVLRSGRVKLIKSHSTGRQQIVKLVSPAGIMGEVAAFENTPYVFTAEAMEDSHICFINKEEFFRFIRERPEIALRMISMLSRELRIARTQMMDIALMDARGRMAGLVLSLAGEYGNARDADGLSLTRNEMAEMIGVSQETAIRLLSQFKDDGLIRTNRRQITILSEERLRMIAGGEPALSEKTS